MTLQKISTTATSFVALIIVFLGLVSLNQTLLTGIRLDLTADRLFTLSNGTRNIIRSIDEPINLYFFYSDQATQNIPGIRLYAQRVRELVQEVVQASNGKLRLQIIDPLPFSEEEDRAAQFGLQGVALGTGDTLYFGLAGTNALDGVEVIPFFQPDREAFLEYELSKLIYNLNNPRKPVLGLMSSLPINGGFNPQMNQPQNQWIVMQQLQQFFEIRELQNDINRISTDEISVLMIVHPKNLPENALFAIDQFALNGGKVLLFIDPFAEIEGTNPNDPMAMMADRSSDLSTLLTAWGVDFDTGEILGDRSFALTVGTQPNQPPVRHLAVIGVDQTGLNREDVVTGQLRTLNLAFAGRLGQVENATTRLVPLVQTSPNSTGFDAITVRFNDDPNQLHSAFTPGGQPLTIAARVSGPIKTAFPEGFPTSEAEEMPADLPEHLTEGELQAIIVADVDLLADRMWVQVQSFFGQRIANPFANNADFVVNAVDNLTGNADLISIRGQAVSARPFTTVQALEREANARFATKEQELQQELRETEARLTELQRSRNDGQSQILTPAQQAELDRFRTRQLEIRRELRQVRRQLDEDIQNLGTLVKIINIGAVPLFLSVMAITLLVFRRRTRGQA